MTDVQILHDKGKLIPADWESRLPNNSSPFYSTMGFLVRKGNPKNIHDWNDLVRSDVKLIFPNPKTSGNARYTYLAAWGAADKADGGDKAKTEQFMTQFLKNVEVFDTGGRGATTTLPSAAWAMLISFESEVNNIRKQYEAQGFEVVIRKPTFWRNSVAWSIKMCRPTARKSGKSLPELALQPAGANHHHRLLLSREQPEGDGFAER
ncbi:MAG: sulfate ABC transporter substrate-binding protein [Escherichia sp.]